MIKGHANIFRHIFFQLYTCDQISIKLEMIISAVQTTVIEGVNFTCYYFCDLDLDRQLEIVRKMLILFNDDGKKLREIE